MSEASRSSDSLDGVLRQGQPAGGLEQDRALARLEDRLFAREAAPAALTRYELGEELGRGGHSVVYEAFDPQLKRPVAIKLLPTRAYAGSGRSRAADRLLREAQALAQLTHPNVIAVHDVGTYGEDDGGVFVVMDLVRGRDLARWIEEAPHKLRDVLDVFTAAGRGLAAAHAAGLVHRDFKPANVFLSDDGHVRVGDFGLARALDDDDPSGADANDDAAAAGGARLTVTGAVVGTPAYMAPEQHDGASPEPRSDQFSFCVSLFEALYGESPFVGTTPAQLAEAKRGVPVDPPHRGRGGLVPTWLRRALTRGLQPDPLARWPSMDALIDELTRRRGRRRRLVGGALLLSGVVGTSVAFAIGAFDRASCEPPASVWTASRRAAVEASFAAAGGPSSAYALSSVDGQLRAWDQRWRAANVVVCEAAGTRPAGLTTRARSCLDARRIQFEAVVDVLTDADRDVVQRASGVAAALPSVDACDDERSLALESDGAPNPALARAKALLDAGRYDDADTIVADLLRDADVRGDHRLAGRAGLVAGDLQAARNRFEAEGTALDRALYAAERAGDEVTATRALVRLVLNEGNHRGNVEAAQRRAEHARARIDRLQLGDPLRAELEHAIGLAHFAVNDFAAARDAYARALELRQRSLPEAHPDVAETHLSIGAAYLAAENFASARPHLERSLELTREIYGPDHPLVGHSLGNLGYLLSRQGRHAEALQKQRRALEIHTAVVGETHVWIARSRRNIGRSLLDLGRADEGLAEFEQAVAIYARLGEDVSRQETADELASARDAVAAEREHGDG